MLKFITLTIFVMLAVVACKASSDEDVTTPLDMTPPEWSRNAVIYEVNVRQFTTAGTFAALAEHLPR